MSEAPDVVYLQWIPEKTWYDDTVTWCEDQINDDDIEYVKVSTATRLRELLRRVLYLHSDFQSVPGITLEKLLKDIEKELGDE